MLPLGSLFLISAIAIYVIFALPIYTMGKKTGSENAWFAFVPILNLVLLLEIADKELWWILLFFIPLANVIALVVVWMAVADAMDKPEWVGLLMLVPFVNIIVPFYLAFA